MTIAGRVEAAATASQQRVWDVLTDPRRRPEWDDAVAWAVCEGALAPGSYLTVKPKRGRRQTAYRIDAVEGPRRFALGLTFGPLASLRRTWTVEPAAEGASIACEIAIDGPLAGMLVRRMALRLLAAAPADLERLARLAEA